MDTHLHRRRQCYRSLPHPNPARPPRKIQNHNPVLKNDKPRHHPHHSLHADDRRHRILDPTSRVGRSSPHIPRVHHDLLHMDPPTSLLHRCSSVPTPGQSRKRTDRRRTRKETDENPRNFNTLPPNRATNIRRMGNFKLAKLDIPERSGGDRQDNHLNNDFDSTAARNLLLHSTLGMASNSTEEAPSGG